MSPKRIKRSIGGIGLLLTFALGGALSAAEEATIELDPTRTQGVWEGWGVSLCWWAKVFGNSNDLADLLFTTRDVTLVDSPLAEGPLPGLGLTIARYNVGACSPNEVDGQRMAVSKIILPYRQIEGFWLDKRDRSPESSAWNWQADAAQRAMLSKAHERGVRHLELFANSPMWWMCRNRNPSGAPLGRDDNLLPEHIDDYVHELVAVALRAKKVWGTPFTTVEPFNEPSSDFWFADCKQEGCHFGNEQQEQILRLLRRELDAAGLRDTRIAASDETSYDHAIAIWKKFAPEVRALVDRINVHGYQYEKGGRGELASLAHGVSLWNSEYGDADGSGMRMASSLHRDFAELRPTAWCYWQAIDGKGWGLIQGDLPHGTLTRTNPKYHMLAQYTRHLRPGMTVLSSGEREIIAARDSVSGRVVLILLNASKQPQHRLIRIARLATAWDGAQAWITEPAGSTRHAPTTAPTIANGCVAVDIPAQAVLTIELTGRAPAEKSP